MLRIGIDVDEVVAQLHQPWLDRYNQDFNDTLTPDDMPDWDIDRLVKPECGATIFKYLTPDLYDSDAVKPYPGTLQAVTDILAMGHAVVFVSHCGANNETAYAKGKWLCRNGFTGEGTTFLPGPDKSNAPCDILIDDAIHNVKSFLTGWPILHTRPHNKRYQWLGKRIRHLDDILPHLRYYQV